MSCQITLIPMSAAAPSVTVPMLEEDGLFAPDGALVYSHCRYRLTLSCLNGPGPSLQELQNAAVLINDEPVSVRWRKRGGGIQGEFTEPNDGFVFRGAFGYAELVLLLHAGGKQLCLRSGFLAVMIRESRLNQSVQTMAEYVCERREDFLFGGQSGSRVRVGLKKYGRQNLFTLLALAQEAVSVYEAGYPYFKANCRFQIQKSPAVQPLERLQAIAPATIQHAVCHPEELQPAAEHTGIRYGRGNYQPRRALGLTNTVSMETYENQALLGFLKTLLDEIRRLRNHGGVLLEGSRKKEDGGLLFSPWFLLAPVRKRLEDTMHPLRQLECRLARLLRLYEQLLPIAAPRLRRAPRLTPVFRSVWEYSRIYECSRRWFLFGLYNFDGRKQFLPFLRAPDLYEVYILSRLFDALEADGWTADAPERREYPLPEIRPISWPAVPDFGNLFGYQKDGVVLTIYYQPVVYSGLDPSAGSNGVGLCRNTSISYRNEPDPYSERDAAQGNYYLPDFLLKIQKDGRTRYIVADAKFASLMNVRRSQLPALVYKYLFSISPINPEDTLSGLCIFCGQSVKEESGFLNIRDLRPDAPEPFAAIVTFPGGAADLPLMEFLKKCLS